MSRQFQRYAKKGDYMPVEGAPCLNMLTAVIDFYKRQPRRLEKIYLDAQHWGMLNEELKRLLGENYERRDSIEFDGCDVAIERNSLLTNRPIVYKFKQQSPIATA